MRCRSVRHRARHQSLIRNYIKATVGFPALAKRTRTPKNSLMRMFGPKGNPYSKNMFGVIAELAKAEGVNLSLKTRPTAQDNAERR